MLDKETYPSSKVVGLASKLIPLKVNVDKDSATGKKFAVQFLPTIVFADSSGKKIHDFVGFKSPDEFVTEMQTALKKAK